MKQEEQWQFIGRCDECQAPMYFKEGEPIKAVNPAPDCTCHIKEKEKEGE